MGTVWAKATNQPTKVNCLLVGQENSGKTTILYGLRLEQVTKTFKETTGFNYETVSTTYKGKRFEFHMWDLAGKPEVSLGDHVY